MRLWLNPRNNIIYVEMEATVYAWHMREKEAQGRFPLRYSDVMFSSRAGEVLDTYAIHISILEPA